MNVIEFIEKYSNQITANTNANIAIAPSPKFITNGIELQCKSYKLNNHSQEMFELSKIDFSDIIAIELNQLLRQTNSKNIYILSIEIVKTNYSESGDLPLSEYLTPVIRLALN